MLHAVEETATWTTSKIAGIRALMEATARHMRERQPNAYSHELIVLVFEQPYCTSKAWWTPASPSGRRRLNA